MATNFNFISPSIQFKETNLTSVAQVLGNTFLGLVGEFPKGPAFEPIQVQGKDKAFRIFGKQSTELIGGTPKYPATYAMNSFLEESNGLTCVRVLGLSGYDAGTGWALKAYGAPDATTEVLGSVTGPFTYTGITAFSGYTLPTALGTVDDFYTDFVRNGSQYDGYFVTNGNITAYNPTTGEVVFDYSLTPATRQPLADYDGTVVAIIRSRGNYVAESLVRTCDGLQITGGTGTFSDEFTLVATDSLTTTQEDYIVSLDPTKRNFLTKVIGEKPFDKNSLIWVEKVYTDSLLYMNDNSLIFGIDPNVVELSGSSFTNYQEQYTGAQTPWVVSEIRGNKVYKLFKFFTVSDGDSSNRDVKISIQNIDPRTKEFDVIVRDFNDTDDRVSILESYTRCTLNENLPSYIGKRIGQADLNGNFKYDRVSDYIFIVADANMPEDAFPCGFEGYFTKDFDSANTGSISALPPKIFYKSSYSATDRVNRVYLGVSDTVYRNASAKSRTSGINADFFGYFGVQSDTNVYKTKGFHMDINATLNYTDGTYVIGEFEAGAGAFNDQSDVANPLNPYYDKLTRKFTVVPYNGFDGWDVYRQNRTNTDLYSTGNVNYFAGNDYEAYLAGIQAFGNSEETEINLFATPNINWFDHLSLVNEGIELCERVRKDCFYIMDGPDLQGNGVAQELADLFDNTGIDTSYAGTFGTWIEVNDAQNNRTIFLPPSTRIPKNFAFTDNKYFSWFATAGQNRGVLDARRTRKKLSMGDRDVMYASRVNPIAEIKGEGVQIYGNKTAQVADNALNRINVRRLLLTAQKGISTIAKQYLFDPNDEVVRSQFETKANAFLNQIKNNRGLYDFRIVGDNMSPEVLDRNEMLYKLLLKPTRALEYIGIDFVVTPTGASFDDVINTLQ